MALRLERRYPELLGDGQGLEVAVAPASGSERPSATPDLRDSECPDPGHASRVPPGGTSQATAAGAAQRDFSRSRTRRVNGHPATTGACGGRPRRIHGRGKEHGYGAVTPPSRHGTPLSTSSGAPCVAREPRRPRARRRAMAKPPTQRLQEATMKLLRTVSVKTLALVLTLVFVSATTASAAVNPSHLAVPWSKGVRRLCPLSRAQWRDEHGEGDDDAVLRRRNRASQEHGDSPPG